MTASTYYWRPSQGEREQIDTITVGGTWAENDVASITIGGITISYTVGAGEDSADVVDGLIAAIAAANNEFFDDLTWAEGSTTTITATGDSGIPFTATVAKTSSSGTIVTATTQAATGESIWTANNFSTIAGVRGLPATGDTVIFEESSVDCLYNLDQSSVAPAAIKIYSSYTGKIGLPDYNRKGYQEYRQKGLYAEATAIEIGAGDDRGSNFIRLQLVTNAQTDVTVYRGTVIADDTGNPNAFNFVVLDGDLTIKCKATNVSLSGGTVVCMGTVGSAFINGGTAQFFAATDSIMLYSGSADVYGAASSYLKVYAGGTLNLYNTVTHDYLYVYGGTVNIKDATVKTLTDCQLFKGAIINDASGFLSFTNPVVISGDAAITDISLNSGRGRKLTIAYV